MSEPTELELAQILAAKTIIAPNDWHRLKSNRQAQSLQQTTAALVFLIKGEKVEALSRLRQAVGWLDGSISSPPCPTHGQSEIQKSEQS
ncbi:MAG: DUF6439 family protein [Cyanobacteriota bacterium ELA615]|jgi:hypothetical protein